MSGSASPGCGVSTRQRPAEGRPEKAHRIAPLRMSSGFGGIGWPPSLASDASEAPPMSGSASPGCGVSTRQRSTKGRPEKAHRIAPLRTSSGFGGMGWAFSLRNSAVTSPPMSGSASPGCGVGHLLGPQTGARFGRALRCHVEVVQCCTTSRRFRCVLSLAPDWACRLETVS